MMRQRTHRRDDRALLPTAWSRRAHEDAGVLAPVGALGPLLARVVKERFPLRREVSVTCGDTEEEGVVFFEYAGADEGNVGLGGRVHQIEDLLR